MIHSIITLTMLFIAAAAVAMTAPISPRTVDRITFGICIPTGAVLFVLLIINLIY